MNNCYKLNVDFAHLKIFKNKNFLERWKLNRIVLYCNILYVYIINEIILKDHYIIIFVFANSLVMFHMFRQKIENNEDK